MAMPKSTEATMARCLDDLSHGNGLAVWVLLNATQRRALVMGWLILNAPDELVIDKRNAMAFVEGLEHGMSRLSADTDVRIFPMTGAPQ